MNQSDTSSTHPQWEKLLSEYLKEIKAIHNIPYREISKRLENIGFNQTSGNLSNKFSSGIIGGPLLIAVLIAMDEESLDLREFKARLVSS
ncbi:MAG: hypothetical protein COB61_002895 [Thiotrichales bacterium]|nr:hypothetical protein [Thiotrichales bacterium]